MSDRFQSEAYKEWAQAQDSEIQTRRKAGNYPVWKYLAEGVAMLPEKGAAFVADQDHSALYSGGAGKTAGDIRQSLFDQMKSIAEKQHAGAPLTEAEKKVQSDWNSLKNYGTVFFDR